MFDYQIEPVLYVNDRTGEVRRNGIVAAGSQDVLPQLTAFPFSPAVGSLVDRNNELRRFL